LRAERRGPVVGRDPRLTRHGCGHVDRVPLAGEHQGAVAVEQQLGGVAGQLQRAGLRAARHVHHVQLPVGNRHQPAAVGLHQVRLVHAGLVRVGPRVLGGRLDLRVGLRGRLGGGGGAWRGVPLGGRGPVALAVHGDARHPPATAVDAHLAEILQRGLFQLAERRVAVPVRHQFDLRRIDDRRSAAAAIRPADQQRGRGHGDTQSHYRYDGARLPRPSR
jgi:hypothetical protein